MKRSFLLACLVAVFLLPCSVYAQAHLTNYYVGLGATHSWEDIKWGGLDNEFNNSWGLNAKFGYHAHRLMDIEFNFDRLRKFDAGQTAIVDGDPLTLSAELKVQTYMVALKGYFPISTDYTKLSAIVGAGIMHGKMKAESIYRGLHLRASESETDLCGKVGLGLDHYLTPNISVGLEGNYTRGFSDLKDIRYWQLGLGMAYHF